MAKTFTTASLCGSIAERLGVEHASTRRARPKAKAGKKSKSGGRKKPRSAAQKAATKRMLAARKKKKKGKR